MTPNDATTSPLTPYTGLIGPKMSPRDRIRHLYRRLAFGATPAEIDLAVKTNFESTRKFLLDYEKISPSLTVDPFELVWRDREKEEPDFSTGRFGMWWCGRMITTPRPLEE